MACEKGWTYEKDEMLIEMVKTKPGLYDLQTPHYSDSNYKRKVWDEIGKALGENDAKVRWETLRAQYRKYLMKLKTKSGQAASKISKWRLADQMNFLTEFIGTDRDRSSSIPHEDIEVEVEVLSERGSESSQQEHPSPPTTNIMPPKRKRLQQRSESATSTLMEYLFKKKEEESAPPDPIDQFFSLMATSVKRFSPQDQQMVKKKVFSLVSETEDKYLFQPSSSHMGSTAFQQNVVPLTSPHFPQYPSHHPFLTQQYPSTIQPSRPSTPQTIPQFPYTSSHPATSFDEHAKD